MLALIANVQMWITSAQSRFESLRIENLPSLLESLKEKHVLAVAAAGVGINCAVVFLSPVEAAQANLDLGGQYGAPIPNIVAVAVCFWRYAAMRKRGRRAAAMAWFVFTTIFALGTISFLIRYLRVTLAEG